MRRLLCLTFLAAPLALWPAPARAQIGAAGFGYGSYTATYGFGLPFFNVRSGFGSAYGFGAPLVGYGYGLGPGLGVVSYNSAYSVYAAPGTTFITGGAMGYPGPVAFGAPAAFAVPGYGFSGTGFGPGFGPGLGFGTAGGGLISTGPFMGLPRPNGGLIRVP